jgi:hypothetical protein
MNSLQKDFLDWVYRSTEVKIRGNEALKLFGGPEKSEGEFRTQCANTAHQACEAELNKVSATYDTKLRTLKEKLDREQRELKQDQAELSSRKMEEIGTGLETVAGLFGFGRKHSISSSITKRRMASQAKGDVEESVDVIKAVQGQMAEIETEQAAALQAVNDKWGEIANQVIEIPVSAQKDDIALDFFGVAWMPYHLVKIGEQLIELRGFSAK